MQRKTFGLLGCLAPILFVATYILMSWSREDYSMYYKAVSELGSIDAHNAWIWNVMGYGVPGLLVAAFSIGLFRDVQANPSRWPLVGGIGSGVMMTVSAIFPGDFDDRQSTTMLLHTIGSFGSYAFYLLAAFTYPRHMKASSYWQKALRPTRYLVWLTIAFGSWPLIIPSHPALGQRFVFFFYWLWILYTAYLLYQKPENQVAGESTQL